MTKEEITAKLPRLISYRVVNMPTDEAASRAARRIKEQVSAPDPGYTLLAAPVEPATSASASPSAARRSAYAPEIEKILNDGSRLVPSGWDEGLLVVYYKNDRTREGFAKQTDPKYREAARDMQIYDVVCFVSAAQHVACPRPADNSAKDVEKSLTADESYALMDGFKRLVNVQLNLEAMTHPPPQLPELHRLLMRKKRESQQGETNTSITPISTPKL